MNRNYLPISPEVSHSLRNGHQLAFIRAGGSLSRGGYSDSSEYLKSDHPVYGPIVLVVGQFGAKFIPRGGKTRGQAVRLLQAMAD